MEAIEDINARLIDVIRSQDTILIIGSGVSMQSSKLPQSTWLGLIESGIRRVCQRDKDQGAMLSLEMEHDADAEVLIGIAHQIKKNLGDDFWRWFTGEMESIRCRDPELIECIGKMGVPILTTNYDTLLEETLNLPSVSSRDADQFRKFLRGEVKGIGHIHGVYTDKDSIVFTGADYDRITSDRAVQDLLTSVFSIKSIVFIGAGGGLSDPNFAPLATKFNSEFVTTKEAHFRLCLENEVSDSSDIGSIQDVSYGSSHDELPQFLRTLLSRSPITTTVNVRNASRGVITANLRRNSLMWPDQELVEEKSASDLIIPPIFLREKHETYVATHRGADAADEPAPVDISELLREPCNVIISGEESSGVSTALCYCLERAAQLNSGFFEILIDDPIRKGPHPIESQIQDRFSSWALPYEDSNIGHLALGVDNYRNSPSRKEGRTSPSDRVISDLLKCAAPIVIIGATEDDAFGAYSALTKRDTNRTTHLLHLGRFSSYEAEEIAHRVCPGKEKVLSKEVMKTVQDSHLPRTPLTITILTVLASNGVSSSKKLSEIEYLGEYVSFVLDSERFGSARSYDTSLSDKLVVLQNLAARFLLAGVDSEYYTGVEAWLSEEIVTMSWEHDPGAFLCDLIGRRILLKQYNDDGETILRFQRSAYFELFAAQFARNEVSKSLRDLMLTEPIRRAGFIRSYVAITRDDVEILMKVNDLLVENLPADFDYVGRSFSNIRKITAGDHLFEESLDPDADAEDDVSHNEDSVTLHYDVSSDSDVATFIPGRFEEFTPVRRSMILADFASRILRDSDQVRDQHVKERTIKLVLQNWAWFIELFEQEIVTSEGFDEVVVEIASDLNSKPESIESLKSTLAIILPSAVAVSGIKACLASTSLSRGLKDLDIEPDDDPWFILLIRIFALMTANDHTWTSYLDQLSDRAVSTGLSCRFLAPLAERAYVSSSKLADYEKESIRRYLMRVVKLQFNFDDNDHRDRTVSKYLNRLKALQTRFRYRGTQNPPELIYS